MAESPGRAKQPVPLSYTCPCAHPPGVVLSGWWSPQPRVPGGALRSPTATPSQEPHSLLLLAPRCVCRGCCRVSRAPLCSPGSSKQDPYPRELKTMLVYLKNNVLFALRNPITEPPLLSSFALPILLLPPLCYSMSYQFLLLILPDDCTRHGLK